MKSIEIIAYIPIVIVLLIFIISLAYCVIKYSQTGRQLHIIKHFISKYKRKDLNYRFKLIDNWMNANAYVAPIWSEFKNTLVFSESVALENNAEDIKYQEISSTVENIQTTVDPLYFFNEETLITSRFNYKLIQTMPTILTGCGPLFTFLNIALAFGVIDFSTQESTISSISSFILSMQTAALVSVIAVGSSLLYLMFEKLMYNRLCKNRLMEVQELLAALFTNISSEKFLFELLRESKVQNNASKNILDSMPEQFKTALNESVTSNLVPYLENVIFGLNQLNKQLKESVQASQTTKTDVVDDLF